jgi:hypothetical protein
MQIIYAQQGFEPRMSSIFLAGPTPRQDGVESWRPQALDILRTTGFQGQVLVPEGEDGRFHGTYAGQVEWEYRGLENCGVICCWVPRDMARMPALTTNIEFGRYVGTGRLYYGRPDGAPHTSYLDWLYKKLTGRIQHNSLERLLDACVVAIEGILQA